MATWIVIVEWSSRLILLFLIGLSVWSISIILERRKFFDHLEKLDLNDNILKWIKSGQLSELKEWSQKNQGLRAGTVNAALERSTTDQMEKSVMSYWAQERKSLEKGLPILGTLGSTTPFVGLLGTILGIIVAFGVLSSGQMDSQKIMYALAEALIMTAIGLGVAIPAVVAYNYFSRRLITLQRECDSIKDLMISYFAKDK
jgi:biopolymer transport protein ExbB